MLTIRPNTDSCANFAEGLRYAAEHGLDLSIVAEVLAVYQEWLLKAPKMSERVQVTGTGWTADKAALFAIFCKAGQPIVDNRYIPCATCGNFTQLNYE
jgi:hypothetical protein